MNLRLSIPTPFGRFYVTTVAGRERRSAARRASERGKHPLATVGNMIVLAIAGTIVGAALIALLDLAAVAFIS